MNLIANAKEIIATAGKAPTTPLLKLFADFLNPHATLPAIAPPIKKTTASKGVERSLNKGMAVKVIKQTRATTKKVVQAIKVLISFCF